MKQEYKKTELGRIPVEWEIAELSTVLDVARPIRYGIVQPGEYNPRGALMLRSQDYSKGWNGLESMHRVNQSLGRQYKNARIVSNDLVITVVGAGIGQVVAIPSWLNGAYLSRSTARIAIDKDKAAQEFIRTLLESPIGKSQILDCQKEGAQPVISCRDIAKFLIPLPSVVEQNLIATVLEDIEKLIARLDSLLSKKRDLKQAVMQQLLTGQTRLPGFTGEWKLTRLRDLGNTYGGLTGKTKNDFGIGDNRYITFMNVMSNVVIDCQVFDKVRISPREQQNKVMRGDLLFNGSSETPEEIAMCSVLLEDIDDLYLNSFCFGFRPKIEVAVSGEFLAYYFRSSCGRELLKSLAQGSTRYNLSKSALLDLQFLLPEIDEQTKIAQVLMDADAEITALEQRRDKIRDLKQAMMQELLTGRTRLVTAKEVENAA